MTASVVLTAVEAAARLGISELTARRWGADGTLKAFRRDPWLFEQGEVERKAAEMVDELRAKLAHLTGEAVVNG